MIKQSLILKNTIFLYIRSILSLIIKLYTSRIILDVLGFEDYGVYQVVGGLVIMFSLLNTSMSISTQRYLGIAIGYNDKNYIQKVFSTAINIHLLISIILFFFIEIVGYYFLSNIINLGEVSIKTAHWILLFTNLSLMLTINSVPYNSLLISYEKMSSFAYIDIIGELLKLGIGFSLYLFSSNRLIYYSALMFAVSLIIRLLYINTCRKEFKECKYIFKYDIKLIKEMLSFSGWTTFASIAYMLKTQGLSVILNIYIGPLLNSALGIANQVNTAVNVFSQNFQMAFVPQSIKCYASKEYDSFNKLILSGTKLSTCLLLVISIPIILEIDFILNLWLVDVPYYASKIIIFLLIESISQCMTCTGNTAIYATGKIKNYQIFYNLTSILSIPIIIIALNYNISYHIPFLILIIFSILSNLVKIFFLKKQIPKFNVHLYIYEIFISLSVVTLISIILPLIIKCYLEPSFLRLLIVTAVFEIQFFFLLYIFAFNTREKDIIRNKLNRIRS